MQRRGLATVCCGPVGFTLRQVQDFLSTWAYLHPDSKPEGAEGCEDAQNQQFEEGNRDFHRRELAQRGCFVHIVLHLVLELSSRLPMVSLTSSSCSLVGTDFCRSLFRYWELVALGDIPQVHFLPHHPAKNRTARRVTKRS